MKLAHKYLLREFLGQFLICAGGISIFMLGFVLYKEASNLIAHRVPFVTILWLLLNQWPLVLLDVMPGAGMFAVILSLGRMVADREIEVFRVSGWSFARIIWPLLALTLVLSYAVFIWNDTVVPLSQRRYNQAWSRLVQERVYSFVNARRFLAGPDNTQFYIGSIDRRTGEMRNLMVYQQNAGTGFPRLITAVSGRMDGQVWTLRNGVLHELDRDGYVAFETGFEQMTVNTKRDFSVLLANQLREPEMNRAKLRAEAEKYESMGFPADGYWLNYHMKLAAPFALFVFAALAVPFAYRSGRSGRLAVFLPALLLYLAYFLILTVLYALGNNGGIAPWLAAWGSNIIFGTLAVGMLFANKR